MYLERLIFACVLNVLNLANCSSSTESYSGNVTSDPVTADVSLVSQSNSPLDSNTTSYFSKSQSNSASNISLEDIDRFTNDALHSDYTTLSSGLENLDQGESRSLEVVYLTPTSGFVQTDRWNGTLHYAPNLDVWAEVTVPEDHDVMLSFTDLDIEGDGSGRCRFVGDSVSLYLGNTSESQRVWRACNTFRPAPGLYTADRFLIHLLTDFGDGEFGALTGFRLRFSFHARWAVPGKLADGTWNCSAPHWRHLQSHLQCNLEVECQDGRDESRGCPYWSERCGNGGLTVAGRCFHYHNLRRPTPWLEAQQHCRATGGRLAYMETPQVWDQLLLLLRAHTIYHVFVGFQQASFTLPDVYHQLYQWSDGTVAYYFRVYNWQDPSGCGSLNVFSNFIRLEHHLHCQHGLPFPFLCRPDPVEEEEEEMGATVGDGEGGGGGTEERGGGGGEGIDGGLGSTQSEGGTDPSPALPGVDSVSLQPLEAWTSSVSVVQCPQAHVTHTFLACDVFSHCWAPVVSLRSPTLSTFSCPAPLSPSPPYFTCANGVQHVPYSLVCDHRPDCADGSDEDFCLLPACRWLEQFDCGRQQCLPASQACDGHEQCVTGSDEENCVQWRIWVNFFSPPPPAIVQFDSDLNYNITSLDTSVLSATGALCPDTHFQCPPDSYCLPVFLRCNGVNDCPGRADEADCTSYACPGFYRCRDSTVCVHPDHLCDGVFQCPLKDDEMMCGLQCPAHCVCHGWSYFCSRPFLPALFPRLRFLQARHTAMTLADLQHNVVLVYLDLSGCGLTHLSGIAALKNLKTLRVRDNLLKAVRASEVGEAANLRELDLAGNPLVKEVFVKDTLHDFTLSSLAVLDLGRVELTELHTDSLWAVPNVQILNLSHCGIEIIADTGFGLLPKLRVVDLRGSEVTSFPRDVLRQQPDLQQVYADNFKLCCPALLPPNFNVYNCHAPVDEISSCDSLLRSDFYRTLLFVLAALALLGNTGGFVVRTFFSPSRAQGFGALVSHLCVSDFLMGVYLLVLGVADQLYRGQYMWQDVAWRHSVLCKVAGFLSFLSSEVSGFIICLITVDRFVVLRFPFSRFRFSRLSGHVACAVVWGVGGLLASVPLFPAASHWQFYSQTAICLPLPVTRRHFPGRGYSFSVMIVLNLVLSLVIAVGQVCIYWSIRVNSVAASASSKTAGRDLAVARRLLTIAASDLACWLPVGLLGVLAARGLPVPGEVSVALAVVALPLNSAINPFLYTLNVLLERRRRAHEERLKKRLAASMRNVSTSGTSLRVSAP